MISQPREQTPGADTGSQTGQALRLSSLRLPALDGLRGLAILLVVLNHYGPFIFTGSSFWQPQMALVARRGYLGVDLFFVLSGFLITGILLDSRGSANYLRKFYWRRSLRIFPLYFFYLSVIFFVVRPFIPHRFTGINFGWYFAYIANWHMARDMNNPYLAHLWSLAVEEQFYIIWPFVVLLFPVGRLVWVCSGIVIGSLVFRMLLVGHVEDIYPYMLTPARMDCLAAGALIAIAIRNVDFSAKVNKFKWPLAVCCAIVWFWTLGTRTEQTLGYSAAAYFFAMIVFWAARSSVPVLTVLPLRTLGKYSYGLYMYHVFPRDTIFLYAQRFLPSPYYKAVFPVVTLCIVFGIAMLSWKFLETPFLRLKDRYSA